MINLENFKRELVSIKPYSIQGRVIQVTGPLVKALISSAAIGDYVEIDKDSSGNSIDALVTGFSSSAFLLSPLGNTLGITPNSIIRYKGKRNRITNHPNLLGKLINGVGLIEKDFSKPFPLHPQASVGTNIRHIAVTKPITTGIRAIDAFAPMGVGQRTCVFGEPGIGKSSILNALRNNCQADIYLVALIGERSREVEETLKNIRCSDRKERTIIIASRSNEPAAMRVQAANTAMDIAEYFAARGQHVFLQLDSLTRLCRAMREVGLAAGEPVVRRGYPPSVFAQLPVLLERAGNFSSGAITAVYTALLTSSLDEDPMVEEIKGILDGHILLNKELSEGGHYPAIDVISSVSRVMGDVASTKHINAARKVRSLLKRLVNDKELAMLSNKLDPQLELALKLKPKIENFLQQDLGINANYEKTIDELIQIAQ